MECYNDERVVYGAVPEELGNGSEGNQLNLYILVRVERYLTYLLGMLHQVSVTGIVEYRGVRVCGAEQAHAFPGVSSLFEKLPRCGLSRVSFVHEPAWYFECDLPRAVPV